MNEISLTEAIGHDFNAPLEFFDQSLRRRIQIALHPLDWNNLGVEARRAIAEQSDRTPAQPSEALQQEIGALFDRLDQCKANLAEWKEVGIPTAIDKAKRDEEIERLEGVRSELLAELARRRGDSIGPDHGEPIPQSSPKPAKQVRSNLLLEEIVEVLAHLKKLGRPKSPREVMVVLKSRAGSTYSCIRRANKDGIFWIDQSGAEKFHDLRALQARLRRLRLRDSS